MTVHPIWTNRPVSVTRDILHPVLKLHLIVTRAHLVRGQQATQLNARSVFLVRPHQSGPPPQTIVMTVKLENIVQTPRWVAAFALIVDHMPRL